MSTVFYFNILFLKMGSDKIIVTTFYLKLYLFMKIGDRFCWKFIVKMFIKNDAKNDPKSDIYKLLKPGVKNRQNRCQKWPL
jgi:hypothetical protein